MKKSLSLLSILSLMALLSGAALYQAEAFGGPGHRGQGFPPGQQLTDEQIAQVQQLRADFLTETNELRQKMAANRTECRTLQGQVNPDQARLKALADEMVDMKAQLAKKANEYQAKSPLGFNGPNCLGKGFGGHMGYAKHNGPGRHGYGDGFGHHQRASGQF